MQNFLFKAQMRITFVSFWTDYFVHNLVTERIYLAMPRITLNIFDATPFRAVAFATMLSFMAFTPVAAQDYQKGYDAYQAGDYATALKEFRPLAEQGNALLQTVVGDMHRKGNGVPQNYAEATKWYRLAAEQGKAQAQYNLGFIYKNGEGVPQDYAEGIKWYRLAADQGYAKAQYNLAVMYENGEGVSQNYAGAVKLYRLAAEQGNAEAQNNLAVSYATGKGLLQDYIMAHMWWNLANANGNENGGINRDRIAEDMTNADIEKAIGMAQECFNSVYTKCGYWAA